MATQDPVIQSVRRFANYLRQFGSNCGGSVVNMFALASIPIIASAGMALDYNRILDANVSLQDLADRAALTAAALEGTESQQEAAGNTFLANNILNIAGVSYTTSVDTVGTDTTVNVDATVDGTLVSVAFTSASGDPGGDTGKVQLAAKARYKDEGGEPICMLTLNATIDNAMYFRGTGNISATGCGFQSDSSSVSQALHLQGNATATADFFYAVGNWMQTGGSGSFSETPEGGKDVKGNPFSLAVTCPTSGFTNWNPSGTAASPTNATSNLLTNISPGPNRWGRLMAGTTYVNGTINLSNNRNLISHANGSTIVLCGPSARISMTGGNLQLQAPNTGPYAGFAVIGTSTATSVNDLTGGPETWIRGIWYTPSAKLNINGNAAFNVNSSYFPIVADQVEIGGTGSINIEMDWAAYGYTQPTQLTTAEKRTVWLVQ